MPTKSLLAALFGLLIVIPAYGQATISRCVPSSIEPNRKTLVVVEGKGFKEPLKISTSIPLECRVEKVEETRVVLELNHSSETPYGPFGLSIATEDAPADPYILFVDDLPSTNDNGANHDMASAQELSLKTVVDGWSDGAKADFYRIHIDHPQRLALVAQAQQVGSSMDVVLRLLDSKGKELAIADDDSVGPDPELEYRFQEAGDYWIEVRDNRYAPSGRYRLRVGDFPVIYYPWPLAAQPGSKVAVTSVGSALTNPPSIEIDIPASLSTPTLMVPTRFESTKPAAWMNLLIRNIPIQVESTKAGEAIAPIESGIPFGLCGQLLSPKERDRFPFKGTKGESIRFTSQTRSLGTSALLQMRIINPAGVQVAETAVNESDEWFLDYTFPEDGLYQLEVNDLLGRGGTAFGYWIEASSVPKFSVAFKPDAKTKSQFTVGDSQGAFAIDLAIARSGYDGPIELNFEQPTGSFNILNPLLPAKSKEARVYFISDAEWDASKLVDLKLIASATELPNVRSLVSTLALQRLRTPHILYPDVRRDGIVSIVGAKSSPAFFSTISQKVLFPKPSNVASTSLQLNRIQKEFKDPVVLLPNQLPAGWSLASTAEKDLYKITLTRPQIDATYPSSVQLLAFGELKGRGRIEKIDLPIEWINPVEIEIDEPGTIVAGQTKPIQIRVVRQGNDPQPIQLQWIDLPKGLVGAESIEIPVDQSTLLTSIKGSSDLPHLGKVTLKLKATSKVANQAFSIESKSMDLNLAAAPARIEVFPKEVRLNGPRDRMQLVVTGIDSMEELRDWTRDCTLTSSNEKVVRVRNGVVEPVGNGVAELQVDLGSAHYRVPVQVESFDQVKPIAFENEVLVALSKQGCNSGACHGSPSGKGSFRLSLRAFDKKLDQLTLIREDFGRRVNTQEAEKSLLLSKPLMKVSHGGGMQLHRNDVAYPILRDWIAEGARGDPTDAPRCVKLEVHPGGKRVLNLSPGKQQLAITALYSDGSRRDVTHLVAYESSNQNVAIVSTNGLVTARQRGEAAILVRYLEHIESISLTFIEEVVGFAWKAPPSNNYIDGYVNSKLKQLQYLPSETCSDSEFIRRVTLDVTGLLPSPEETKAFLEDASDNKRDMWIDRLVERPEYAKFWGLKWCDLLKVTSKTVGEEGVHKYHRWVEQSLRENMPYDRFARELLTASGSTLSNPPANFYRTATDMNECVENISQVFMGARLQCAKCHNHPFERWTQDNYYGMGAFFQRVQRRKTVRVGEQFIWGSNTGEVTQPRTGEVMKPWLPQLGSIEVDPSVDRREPFVDWLVRPDNPYFARIEVNRIWSNLFARGIVDPIDDFRDSNPPSNEPLLDALAKDFVANGYDRKKILKTILRSRTYQAGFQTNPFNQDDTKYFSHQEPRLLGAEQLLDAINQALGTTQSFGNLPAEMKATQLPAPDLAKNDFLKVFGQPERATVCACERTEDSNLGMAIELFNGPLLYEKLRNPNNRFRKSIADGKSVEDTIQLLYLSTISRPPTELELKTAVEHCSSRSDPIAGLEDVSWALINTDEFLFQH